jgi:leader peptidase (prepilin peptidase) / N-methyltransferase
MTIAEYLAASPALLLLFTFILGLLIGSFLNVVIYRYPKMLEADWQQQCHEFLELPPQTSQRHFTVFNLATPGSHCPNCNHAISALENIPVLSWLLQGGKCKHCRAPISRRYPVIETVTGLLSLLVVSQFGFSWLSLALLVFSWVLITLTMIDVDKQLLPDDLTLPLLWLGLLVNSLGWLTDLESAVFGAMAGYLKLWCVYWGFKLLTGKDGMGYGDFKLLAALGAWLGWQALPQIILLSSFVGALAGISMMLLRGHGRDVPIPFGPYLASAGFLALLWGEDLNRLFFAFMG